MSITPSDTEHRVNEIRMFSLNDDQSGYVDSVVIGQKVTTEDPGMCCVEF